MLTKDQKKSQVALAKDRIKNSKTVLFTDFSGVSTAQLEALKRDLREKGAVFQVFKKRLLRIALDEAGIEFDPMANDAQLAGIFSPDEISEIAGSVHKYGKVLKKENEKANLEVLGAYDGENSKVLTQEEFTVIAKLPSKDVLIAHIMGGITGPLRAVMSIISQLSEGAGKSEEEAKPEEVKEEASEEVKTETKEEEKSATAEEGEAEKVEE